MIVWKLGNKPEKILLKEPHKSFDLTGVEVSLLCIGSEILVRWHKENLYLCVYRSLKTVRGIRNFYTKKYNFLVVSCLKCELQNFLLWAKRRFINGNVDMTLAIFIPKSEK